MPEESIDHRDIERIRLSLDDLNGRVGLLHDDLIQLKEQVKQIYVRLENQNVYIQKLGTRLEELVVLGQRVGQLEEKVLEFKIWRDWVWPKIFAAVSAVAGGFTVLSNILKPH